ncbi:hypothetical protein [Symbioplanes lichenis]|uniref:hypothetical protein n=1 Tax=Symbioplanes lichenis TaxID=1629072 RepID=UPI002738D040|nr:hypothetical protein [Actinoplanes lichenis]
MTSISALGSSGPGWTQTWAWTPQTRPVTATEPAAADTIQGTSQAADQVTGQAPRTRDLPPPPPPGGPDGSRGEVAGLRDSSKLNQLSGLLDMSEDDVTTSATSATKLVELLQTKGVDLGQLRTVLTSGDLLDVRA